MLSFPPELLREFARHLSRHQLTICVRVCQEWHAVFNSSLWEKVLLDSPRDSDSRFASFKQCVEAGALSRSGRLIRVLRAYHYETASLLITYGATACTDIVYLKLGSKSDAAVDNEHAIRLFEQSTRLKHLRLVGQMVWSATPKFEQLMAAIPTTLELLFLHDVEPDEEQYLNAERSSAEEAVTAGPRPLIPFLPRLASLGPLDAPIDNASWPMMFQNCPNLKTLCLNTINGQKAAQSVSSAAREHCPKLNQLRLFTMTHDEFISFDEVWATLLSSSTCGWDTLKVDMVSTSSFTVGPLSMAALLHPRHASTLKILEFGYGAKISSDDCQRLHDVAPNLTITVDHEIIHRRKILEE
ncbi:hypothetical protein BGZ96_003452 [Linnemannia gamsii]|uniref:F-box domain-containing protein n=1 Tax=Linnemannia gamsii TaxID=64522 RepID=A0ABQ7K8G0_9FUNG|nr:hypothetical protein BGZ96_003452 [Linnemannia gamsii]